MHESYSISKIPVKNVLILYSKEFYFIPCLAGLIYYQNAVQGYEMAVVTREQVQSHFLRDFTYTNVLN